MGSHHIFKKGTRNNSHNISVAYKMGIMIIVITTLSSIKGYCAVIHEHIYFRYLAFNKIISNYYCAMLTYRFFKNPLVLQSFLFFTLHQTHNVYSIYYIRGCLLAYRNVHCLHLNLL